MARHILAILALLGGLAWGQDQAAQEAREMRFSLEWLIAESAPLEAAGRLPGHDIWLSQSPQFAGCDRNWRGILTNLNTPAAIGVGLPEITVLAAESPPEADLTWLDSRLARWSEQTGVTPSSPNEALAIRLQRWARQRSEHKELSAEMPLRIPEMLIAPPLLASPDAVALPEMATPPLIAAMALPILTSPQMISAEVDAVVERLTAAAARQTELERLRQIADQSPRIEDRKFLSTVWETAGSVKWLENPLARLVVLDVDAEIRQWPAGTCLVLDVGDDGEFGVNWAEILRINQPPRVMVNWRQAANIGHIHGAAEMARKAKIIHAMIGLVRENSPQSSTWAFIANGAADYVELQAAIDQLPVDGIAVWNLTNFAALHDAKLLIQRFNREFSGRPIWLVGFYGERPQPLPDDKLFALRLRDSRRHLHDLGYAGLNLVWARSAESPEKPQGRRQP